MENTTGQKRSGRDGEVAQRRQKRALTDDVQFADNPEPRCPCVLLLDTSGSMKGQRIQALNEGLQTLRENLLRDNLTARRVEIAIVTFNSRVRVVQDFVTVDRFRPPALTAAGETHMGEGIERALDLVAARKEKYKAHGVSYYRPWVFMITDGQPEGEAEDTVSRAARRLRVDEHAKRALLFAVAVEGADVRRLSKIVVRPPLELEGFDFREMFLWLSASMQSVSNSQPGDIVTLPPIGWLKRISIFIGNHEDVIKGTIAVARTLARVAGVPV